MQLEEMQVLVAELAEVYQNFLSHVIAGKDTLTLEQFKSKYRLKYDRHMRTSIDRITEVDVFQPHLHTPQWGHKLFVARIGAAPFLIGMITDREGDEKVASFSAGLPKGIYNTVRTPEDFTHDFRTVRLLEFFKTFITKSERGDPNLPAIPSPQTLFSGLNGFWNRHIQYSGLLEVKAFDLIAVGRDTYRLIPIDSESLVVDITELPSGAQRISVKYRESEDKNKEYEELGAFNASIRSGHDFGPVFINELLSSMHSLAQDIRMENFRRGKKGEAVEPSPSLNRKIQFFTLFSMRLMQVSNNLSMECRIIETRSVLLKTRPIAFSGGSKKSD